jgi:hypothetical protein
MQPRPSKEIADMSTMTRPTQALTYARVMSDHPRPSQEIAKEIMRRTANERFIASMQAHFRDMLLELLTAGEPDHPGYDDYILTRAHRDEPMSERRAAWYDWIMKMAVQS